jgi:hypothetical protein
MANTKKSGTKAAPKKKTKKVTNNRLGKKKVMTTTTTTTRKVAKVLQEYNGSKRQGTSKQGPAVRKKKSTVTNAVNKGRKKGSK